MGREFHSWHKTLCFVVLFIFVVNFGCFWNALIGETATKMELGVYVILRFQKIQVYHPNEIVEKARHTKQAIFSDF